MNTNVNSHFLEMLKNYLSKDTELNVTSLIALKANTREAWEKRKLFASPRIMTSVTHTAPRRSLASDAPSTTRSSPCRWPTRDDRRTTTAPGTRTPSGWSSWRSTSRLQVGWGRRGEGWMVYPWLFKRGGRTFLSKGDELYSKLTGWRGVSGSPRII